MNKFLRILILSTLFISCSSDLNFDQVNDLKLEPVIVANLATFDVPANEFVVGGIEQNVAGDVMNFDVFRDTYFNNSLVKVDFLFKIDNTINRTYKVNLYLLDASNTPLYTIPFDVPANTIGITKNEIFENAKLDLLKKTTKIGFVITMYPGPALSESSLGSLKLRSSATVYLVVE